METARTTRIKDWNMEYKKIIQSRSTWYASRCKRGEKMERQRQEIIRRNWNGLETRI